MPVEFKFPMVMSEYKRLKNLEAKERGSPLPFPKQTIGRITTKPEVEPPKKRHKRVRYAPKLRKETQVREVPPGQPVVWETLQKWSHRCLSEARKRGWLPNLKSHLYFCTRPGCPREAYVYDHRSYFRPLDVWPVCWKCNIEAGHAAPGPGWDGVWPEDEPPWFPLSKMTKEKLPPLTWMKC